MHLGDPAMGSPWDLAGWSGVLNFWGWKLGALDAPLQITPGLTPNMSRQWEIHHELKICIYIYVSPIGKNGWGFPACYVSKTRRARFLFKTQHFGRSLDGNRHFLCHRSRCLERCFFEWFNFRGKVWLIGTEVAALHRLAWEAYRIWIDLISTQITPKFQVPNVEVLYLIKGSLDEKLPSYELLKMLKVIDS